MMELRDLYWLAGWLEGEGSFTFNTGTKPYISNSPRISSVSTDRDVVNRAATIMNTHLLGPYNTIIPGKIRKPNWKTYANGALAAGWMMTLFVLMGQRRQDDIKHILLQWKAAPFGKPRVVTCHPTQPYYAKGFCHTCYDSQKPSRKERQIHAKKS